MNDRFWQSVGDALRQDNPPAPPDAVPAMLAAAAMDAEPVAPRTGLIRHARFAAQLLAAQLRLIRLAVWLASVLVMGFGVALAMVPAGGVPGAVLAMVAPFVAAAGIAAVCGPDRDPGWEVTSSTVTSPAVVLVARVTLVFGYDLVLAMAASAVLAGAGVAGSGLASLAGAWFGPMALLSSVCLLLSVAVGTTTAITVALALWVSRLLIPVLAAQTAWLVPLARGVEALWTTNLLTCLVAAALVGAAVVLAGRVGGRTAGTTAG
jgi:hypothetical protein